MMHRVGRATSCCINANRDLKPISQTGDLCEPCGISVPLFGFQSPTAAPTRSMIGLAPHSTRTISGLYNNMLRLRESDGKYVVCTAASDDETCSRAWSNETLDPEYDHETVLRSGFVSNNVTASLRETLNRPLVMFRTVCSSTTHTDTAHTAYIRSLQLNQERTERDRTPAFSTTWRSVVDPPPPYQRRLG